MQTLRIFIASSSELADDRQDFREFLSVENDRLHKKGVYLELVQWEHFLDAVSDTRLQDEYNAEMEKCDLMVCLFFSKAGKYTLEEFDTAFNHFKATGKPLIYTYFKTGAPEPAADDEPGQALLSFKKHLADTGHFYTRYENVSDLKLQFRRQLDRLEDKGIIALREQIRYATGEKAFNEHLTKNLIEAVAVHLAAGRRFLEKVGNKPGWEAQTHRSDIAKRIIAYSFVGEIGKQLGKLMAIGKEGFSENKIKKYILKCLHISKRTLDLTCFALLSELWESQKARPHILPEKIISAIGSRMEGPLEPTLPEQFQLFQALCLYFFEEKNGLKFPLPELADLPEIYGEDSPLSELCERLHFFDEKIERIPFNLLDCFEAENLLTDFLAHFSFLVNYKMASIKHIGYRQIRNAMPHYLHRYAALGIDNKANVDAEKVNYTPGTVHTHAVLLHRGEDYSQSINLFPFVIDFNALTFEYGAKTCFFRCRDMMDDSLEFLFLEDNSVVQIERQGILKPDTDLNELMMSEEKRKILNLDSVVEQFEAALRCLLGGGP